MAWSDNLDGVHYDIAAYSGASLRVIAGPGTGKTYALMRRIARLLESGEDPESILAVTFTRTSARDLVDQLAKLGVKGATEVVARTLHSLSFSVLSRSAALESTGRVPRPLLECERAMLVADLSGAFGGKRKVETLIKAFEAYWARLQHDQPGWPTDPTEQRFDVALRSWLRFHQAMLVGELIPLAFDYLRANPAAPDRPAFKHVLADEYQDLNRADQALIEQLAADKATITVVGDEDQSIYAFRHAHPEGITEFDQRRPGTQDAALEQCRRCPHVVVDMATALIKQNKRSRDSVLQARAENPLGNVAVVQHGSLAAEAESIAAFVDHYLKANPELQAGQVLILATRRLIGYAIRDALNDLAESGKRGWAALSFFPEESLGSVAAKEGIVLLALLADRSDRAALRAWLGIDQPSDCRAPAYARVRAHCESEGMTPLAVLEELDSGALRLPHTNGLVERFRMLKKRLLEIDGLPLEGVVDAVFPVEGDCNAVRELALEALDNATTAEELLAELRTLISQPELPSDQSQFVRVMSLHKSKGLTAKCVIVAGCVAGALPTLDPSMPPELQADTIEEQRRLFYVALTRTTETLVLSSAVRMDTSEAFQMGLPTAKRLGQMSVMQASPYIAQLGASCPKTETTAQWRARVGF